MKVLGIFFTVIGAINILITLYFMIFQPLNRGLDIGWTVTWAPILGILCLGAGLTLLLVFRKDRRENKS